MGKPIRVARSERPLSDDQPELLRSPLAAWHLGTSRSSSWHLFVSQAPPKRCPRAMRFFHLTARSGASNLSSVRVSVIPNASASTPSSTPANLALGGSGHADAINSYPTRTACFTDLRDHAVWLMKWRGRHGLHGRCQGQGKSNSDQSDHSFLQFEPLKTLPAQSRLFVNPCRVMKKIVKGRT